MDTTDNKMKLALYRKYRPISLGQVIGQPQVTDILSIAAKEKSFAHAYLFTGQRGTGKTTVARILAHLINDLDYSDNINSDNIDIIEIDAASNNGVDDVREIRDSVKLVPMSCSHKVYIIDEFHMLSKPAFNALLKTIEEPPEYTVFILATTELQKVPATILSRVQRFHFKPVSAEQLAGHLRYIADQEGIKATDEALLLIAKQGGGSVRDSITLLDQLSGNKEITVDTVNDILGMISGQLINELIDYVLAGDYSNIIRTTKDILDDGTSVAILLGQLIRVLEQRALENPVLYKLMGELLDINKSSMPDIKLLSVLISVTNRDEISTLPPAINIVKTATKPVITKTEATKETEVTRKAKAKVETEATKATVKKETKKEVANEISSAKEPAEDAPQAPQSATVNCQPIDDLVWDDIIKQLSDQDRPSTLSLLKQCDYRYNNQDNTLTLFFGKAFHRKQAKTETIHNELLATFVELYNTKPTIIISDDKAPADSDVAAVLNIVGGEVTSINGEI